MPFYHDIEAAVPPTGGGPVDKTLLRNAVTVRAPTVVADDENPSDLVCVDPETGAAIIDLFYLGRIFHYDPTDLVTPPDGTTCLVSYEGRRYKLSDGADVFAYSVLDNSLATPPGSPAVGDAYLIAAAATGAWAGHSNEVTFFSSRGWEFVDFGIGRLIYVESLEAYYHRKTTGDWSPGFGNLTIGTNSIPLGAAINFGRYVTVENRTTTSPPGTAAVGTAYIIGPSATGAWSGQDAKLAICEVANTFTIYTPGNGWQAFDKSSNSQFVYNGSAWVSSAGSWISRASQSVATSGFTFVTTSSCYQYSTSSPPTTAMRSARDNGNTLSFTAKRTGSILRFRYQADVIFGLGGSGSTQGVTSPIVLGLFRDSVVNALDWCVLENSAFNTWLNNLANPSASLSLPTSLYGQVAGDFQITSPDTSAHLYYVAVLSGTVNGNSVVLDVTSLTRRNISLQESA